jgi:hypothetical protein
LVEEPAHIKIAETFNLTEVDPVVVVVARQVYRCTRPRVAWLTRAIQGATVQRSRTVLRKVAVAVAALVQLEP